MAVVAANDIIILDGGTGRELKALGAPFRQPEWSALSLMEPEGHAFVKCVHQRFTSAGARVITTNSYACVPFHLGQEIFAARGPELAALAGRLAREAVDSHADVRIAGSLPPVLGSYRADLFDAIVAKPILSALVDALDPNVDIWLAETLSSSAEAILVKEVLVERGGTAVSRPLWLSFTLLDGELAEKPEEGISACPRLRSGETVESVVAIAINVCHADAVLFNCSQPEVMGAAIDVAVATIRSAGGTQRIGVYANGFPPQSSKATANAVLLELRKELTPEAYSEFARDWKARGATIIGGCCGIGAEHIKAVHSALIQ